jgi:plasmid stabilization system protein ParE
MQLATVRSTRTNKSPFLRRSTYRLADDFFAGKPVPGRPRLCYLLIKRRTKGHGHIVVYRLRGDVIEILDFFHKGQDWPGRLTQSH